MTTRTTIRSGDNATLASPALLPMLVACCSAGVPGRIYTFDPGDDVSASLGGGTGADECYALLRQTGGRVRFSPAEPTWGPVPSVVKVGGGPSITVALADGADGPFDNFKIVYTITTGGAGGAGAAFDAAYDGSTIIESLPIPAEIPAVLRGTVDIGAFTYPFSGLDSDPLVFTSPAAASITFGADYDTPQDIVDDFNTQAAALPTAGSLTSNVGSFPVALATGDTFLGKVDEQSVATTLTIAAVAATKTGSGATYAAVTAGHTITVTLAGVQHVVTFAGTENSQALYHAAINAQVIADGFVANNGGQTKFFTNRKGSGATGSIGAGDSDVLASLGLSASAFTAGTGNVANVAAVTASEFAGLLTSTFTGGTAGSTGTAIGSDRVRWATNTVGASPSGVHFTSGTGVSKIAGFNTTEHNGTDNGLNLNVLARVAQDGDGNSFFELYSVNAGTTVTVTVNTASAAAVVLGFGPDNHTATGAPATISPPWTGLTFTFPASSVHEVGTTYTTTCQGPVASIGAIVDAANTAHDDYKNNPFGFLVVGQPASTAANCAALESALATLQNTWIADPTAPVFVAFVVGSPFHVASPVLATNNANIQTADAALLLAFQAASANFGNVAVEDVYMPGSTSLRFGSYRRTSAIVWGAKHASAAKIAADVADGLASEVTLLGPDLLTRARDDATATTKLGGDQGPGFSALKSTSAGMGFVKFVPGATRAGPTSRLRFIGPLTVGLEIAREVFPFVELWEGQTDRANPVTRQYADDLKASRANDVFTLLAPTLTPVGQPPNVTKFTVTVTDPPTGVWLDDGITPVNISYIPLGEITSVLINITATGVLVATPTT